MSAVSRYRAVVKVGNNGVLGVAVDAAGRCGVPTTPSTRHFGVDLVDNSLVLRQMTMSGTTS